MACVYIPKFKSALPLSTDVEIIAVVFGPIAFPLVAAPLAAAPPLAWGH